MLDSEKPTIAQAMDPKAFAKDYLNHLNEIFNRIDLRSIEATIQYFEEARNNDRRIFFIGNGGSAATASHFANDFSQGIPRKGKPFRAISLTDNVAVITAVGNDRGYDQIFVEQLKPLLQSGDLVVAISASGNSPNVLKAIDYANTHGGHTIGMVGFNGGKLKDICEVSIHVPTEKGEYGPVEDVHMVMDHLIASYFMKKVAAE